MTADKSIVIIGINGFIGSKIARYFSKKNFEIIGCDIHSSSPYTDKYYQVNKIKPDYTSLFLNQKIAVCINASGTPGVAYSISHPQEDFELNVNNVYNLLASLKEYNSQCKFITFSSAAVYGNPQKLPIAESDTVKPISPYGWHKYLSEIICKEFTQLHAIPTLPLRVFSVYGPGLKKQLLWDIYNKIKKEKKNKISLFGTGNESRDFIFIDDLLLAVATIIENSSFDGHPVNIASGKEHTIHQLATILLNYLNPDFILEFSGEEKKGDPKNWCADISKLKKIGFNPAIDLKEGLEKYAKWVKENA